MSVNSDEKTIKTDGIVLKSTKTGESDRLLFILTRDMGVVRAFAKSAERPKNKLHSSTNVFCYGDFTLYRTSTAVRVNECELKEQFYFLRLDLKKLSLAGYFAELVLQSVDENIESEQILRLLLNSLSFLCGDKKNPDILKGVFELRLACLLGYTPSLVACDRCGKFESEKMSFNASSGLLLCDECETNQKNLVDLEVITAMRQIVFSELSFVFSVRLEEKNIPVFNSLMEKYISNCLEKKFKTLDFYKSL